jgi:hypothetical protein
MNCVTVQGVAADVDDGVVGVESQPLRPMVNAACALDVVGLADLSQMEVYGRDIGKEEHQRGAGSKAPREQ